MDVFKIKSVESANPHLTWVRHDLYDISGRIRDIEPGLFIMRNHFKEKFEVHSTNNKGKSTYCYTVPYDELDGRTLLDCRERSLSNGGYERLLEIIGRNELPDEKRSRDFAGTVEAAGFEAAKDISLALEKDQLHSGYMRSHHMGGKSRNDGQRGTG